MKEEEIRPRAIFDEYLALAEKDTVTYFGGAERVRGGCPACGEVGEFAFAKSGFDYESCRHCRTLFVNPRPTAAAFAIYYTDSPSARYWATTFYKETADARREKLWRPKAQGILGILTRYAVPGQSRTVIDIGGGYGLFAEEILRQSGQPPIVIEPGPALAQACRDKNLRVIQKFLENIRSDDLPDGPKAFVSFELFEHLHSPAEFLRCLHGLMKAGDLFIFTTLSGIGVDIQVLWEKSKSVTPPHHLNFLNPRAARLLLERTGLEVLDITTPGMLDLDILVNARSDISDRFWCTLIDSANEAERQMWQQCISSAGRSSHMMVICRKP